MKLEKHIEIKLHLFGPCVQFTADLVFCACVVILQGYISPSNANQATINYTLYYTRAEVGISTRKNMFLMNWYSFLGHDYSFCNANVSCLIPLIKTIFLVFAIVCRRLDPPSIGNRPYGHPLLIFFSKPSTFG